MSNKMIAAVIVAVLVLALAPVAAKIMGGSHSAGDAAADKEALAGVAEQVATQLAQGNFEAAAAKFDSTMKSAMTRQLWDQTWNDLTDSLGAFQRITGTRVTRIQSYDVVFVGYEFERGKADLQVTFDSAGQVSGLFIR